MKNVLGNYYGTDIVGMVLIAISIYLIGEKNKLGFITSIIGNISWIIFSMLASSIPSLILNGLLIILNIRGYINWKK